MGVRNGSIRDSDVGDPNFVNGVHVAESLISEKVSGPLKWVHDRTCDIRYRDLDEQIMAFIRAIQ